ncbi:MAG TPA: lipopolysaccharide heptosyltransferase I [Thermoanaerobaculia bacterium]|nr:lipopolysaccharide heptosyltransferase I [Thermoanaerobaculia bacterium]
MRILLIRTSALGDVVHCLPVLTALRRHLPEAKIGWVVEGAMAPVLAGHPDLDELLVVRLRAWRKKPFSPETRRELAAFRDALDRFAPDVTLDLMGNHKAGVLSALTLCDRRIGPARAWRREPSSAFWISEPVEIRGTHAVDRALSLLDALGIPPEPADFGGEKIFRPEPDQLPGGLPEEPYVLIHPGAGWANKRYPPERWGEVARRLRESIGLPAWVPVAPGEEGLAAEIAATSGRAARTVPADLPTLAALLRRARLVMGGDSGPTHLAHALGTPVLMLMGPTDPERHGPYGAPERAMWKLLPCSFCYRRFDETKACLLEIPADRVAERANEFLKISPCPPFC